MRKFLLSLLVGLLFVPLNMSAITADDLVGKVVLMTMQGSKGENDMINGTYSGEFKKISNSRVRLTNFLGMFDVTFDISGNTLTMLNSSSGITTTYDGVTYTLISQNVYSYNDIIYDSYGDYYNSTNNYIYTNLNSNLTATATATGTSYIISSNNILKLGRNDGELPAFFDYFNIYVLEPNATMTDYSSSGTRTYDLKVTFDGNNVNFAGWGNIGSAVTTNYSGKQFDDRIAVNGTINYSTNTVTIPAQQVTAETVQDYYHDYMVPYYAYGNSLYTLLNARSDIMYCSAGFFGNVEYQGFLSGSTSARGQALTGKYVPSTPSHTLANSGWVSNGGNTRTYLSAPAFDFTGKPWGVLIYQGSTFYSEYSDLYTGAYITMNTGNTEYTHAVSLSADMVEITKTGSTVRATISGVQNSDYVASYDLYAVPGNITSISGQSLSSSCGIMGAELVKSGITSANGSVNASFSPSNTFINNVVGAANNVTLFLKANYNVEGVAPTFHALTSVEADLNISDVEKPTATVTVDGDITDGPDFFFMSSASVKLSAATGASIYYTTDGSVPTTASTVYSSPIAIDQTTTVKAIAVKDGERSAVLTLTIVKLGPSVPGDAFDSNAMKLVVFEDFSKLTSGSSTNNPRNNYLIFNSSTYQLTNPALLHPHLGSNDVIGYNCYQGAKSLIIKSGEIYFGSFNGRQPLYIKIHVTNKGGDTNTLNIKFYDEDTEKEISSKAKSQSINRNASTKVSYYIDGFNADKVYFAIYPGNDNYALQITKLEVIAVPLATDVNVGVPTSVTYSYDEDSLDEFVISSYKGTNGQMVEASVKNLMVTKQDVSSINVVDYDFTGMTGMTTAANTTTAFPTLTSSITNPTEPTAIGVHHMKTNLPYAPEMTLMQPVAVNGALGFKYCYDVGSKVGATGYSITVDLPDAESFEVLSDWWTTNVGVVPKFTVMALNPSTGSFTSVSNVTTTLNTTNSWQNNKGISFTKAAITGMGLDPTKVRIVCQIVTSLGSSYDYNDYFIYTRNFRVVAHNVPAGQTVNQLFNVQPSTDGNFVVPADILGNDNVANNYFFSVRSIGFDPLQTWYYSNWYLENGQMIPVIYRPPHVFTGVKYYPASEITTHQEYQNNSEYHGYILCTVTSGNVVVGLSQHNHPSENAIAACPLVMDETGTVYNDDEVDVREFYIGGNETDGYYFWCRESGVNKVLATDPDLDDLYLETKTQAVNNGHIYRCSIEFADKSKSQRRINRLNPGVTLPAATISFSDNTLNLNSADDAFIANIDEGAAPIYLFSSENWETTGVESLGEIVAPYVSIDGRGIVINGTDAAAAVYTLAGVEVYFGYGRRIALEPGVYVVKVDDVVAKVAIK